MAGEFLLLLGIALIILALLIAVLSKVNNSVNINGNTGATGATGESSASENDGIQTLLLVSSVTGYAPITDHDVVGAWGMVLDLETIGANSVDVWVASNGSNVQIGSLHRFNYSFDINTGATGIAPVIIPSLTEELLVTGPTGTVGLSGIVVNYNPTGFIISGS